MIENLANDLEQEHTQYMEGVKKRHSNTADKLRALQIKVSKNIRKKPAAQVLARELEKNRDAIDGQMEEAMRLCEQGNI